MSDEKKLEDVVINKSPTKAIRMHCLECCNGSAYEVKHCTMEKCPLYAFRFGKSPYRKREYTPEQRKAIGERLHKTRKAKKK